jgi:hypothetical protein
MRKKWKGKKSDIPSLPFLLLIHSDGDGQNESRMRSRSRPILLLSHYLWIEMGKMDAGWRTPSLS